MKALKPLLWIAVGLVIGAAGALTAHSAHQQKPAARLQITSAGRVLNNDAYFIKDSKTGACWLALKWTSIETSLAAAPSESCD